MRAIASEASLEQKAASAEIDKQIRLGRGVPKRSQKIVDAVEAFPKQVGGLRPIHRILIANNGIAAVKFTRSIRHWAYKCFGDERAVTIIIMCTPEDMRIGAEHIRLSDQFVECPGGSNNNNYANVRLIVQIAERTNATAVWPGWGHASENPDLPAALAAKGIAFLGPPSEPMAALGDKVGSTILAQAAGVPTLPWSGTGVSLAYAECNGKIPPEVYARACIHDAAEAKEACRKIGYPIMLKASWGGGGKGIRMVQSEEHVEALFSQVSGEVPGSPIFAMQLAPQSRHLEVQLLADEHGNVCAVHSRDCSIQRRHQKIIEEGPCTAASPETLREMELAAIELAKHVGYVGAATVEYLYGIESKGFYFLELNPRLQVEHPVSEWISDVNLPACQLMIAMGIPLHRMPDIRRLYGKDVDGTDEIDFIKTIATPPRGHVVAVRITSEDPDDGFKPTSGVIEELSFRSTPDVWGYFSVKPYGGIHEYSDSQFGHIFAKGDDRREAIHNMVVALKDVSIRGEIRTIVDYAIDMVQCDDFVGNELIHTGWLDSRISRKVKAGKPPWHLSVVAGALRSAMLQAASRLSEYLGYLEKGQIPPAKVSLVTFTDDIVVEGVKYSVQAHRMGEIAWQLTLNGSTALVEGRTLRDGGILMQLDGASHVIYAEKEALGTRLGIDSKTCLLQNEEDPSRLLAVTPGKLIKYLVEDGSHNASDMPYAEVEVMKMIMPLLTPAAGVIKFRMPEGFAMAAGDLIADLELDDLTAVRRATPFEGVFPELGRPTPVKLRFSARFDAALAAAYSVMAGYEHNVETVVTELLFCLDAHELPLQQWQEAMAVLSARLPPAVTSLLDSIAMPNHQVRALEKIIKEDPAMQQSLQPLLDLARSHEFGREAFARSVTARMFEQYLEVEEHFSGKASEVSESDVVDKLRKEHSNSLPAVVDIVLSRQNVANKTQLVICLMGKLVVPSPAQYHRLLRRFSRLQHPTHKDLAICSSQLLEQSMLGELRAGVARSLSGLDMFADSQLATSGGSPAPGATAQDDFQATPYLSQLASFADELKGLVQPPREGQDRFGVLVEAQAAVEDALAGLLDHSDDTLEVYVRRLYHPSISGNVTVDAIGQPPIAGEMKTQIASWLFTPLGPDASRPGVGAVRGGTIAVLASLSEVQGAIHTSIAKLGALGAPGAADGGGSNVVHIALAGSQWAKEDAECSKEEPVLGYSTDEGEAGGATMAMAAARVSAVLLDSQAALREAGVGVVTVLVPPRSGLLPRRCGFQWSEASQSFEVAAMLRTIDAPYCDQLELARIAPLNPKYCNSQNRQYHLYVATEKHSKRPSEPPVRRVFLRGAMRQMSDKASSVFAKYAQGPAPAAFHLAAKACVEECSEILRDCFGELAHASYDPESRARAADWAHVFVSVLPGLPLAAGRDPAELRATARGLHEAALEVAHRHSLVVRRAAVAQWELRLKAAPGGGAPEAVWRVVVSNPSGHNNTVDIYMEQPGGSGAREVVRYASMHDASAGEAAGPLDGLPVLEAYARLDAMTYKRIVASRGLTTYCYDFPRVFGNALAGIWSDHAAKTGAEKPTEPLIVAQELVLPPGKEGGGALQFVERDIGNNETGMIAWLLTLRTPECPAGRQIMAIANDVTHDSGAFGPVEDHVFQAATQRALAMRIPVVYLAANSGARIGLADEVKSCFKVEWQNATDPSRGFKYFYLDDADHAKLSAAGALKARPVTGPTGDRRWMLTDIIGVENGLGVECLSASGSIASEYSRAYKEGFTVTLVSGRTVGIGAYLARLGQRCIQRSDQPIILTGFHALNKVLGRQVYTSQMQLGGPRIMGTNGVSHKTVDDDLEGAAAILTWISYVPAVLGGAPPSIATMDPIDRAVGYHPNKEVPCDPRAAVAGVPYDGGGGAGGHWAGGLFDRGTWNEYQAGWARTVVTGRARLGGLPVGIVAVETQTIMLTTPADPGMPETSEHTVPQAGQVWFPDSADKTAQSIEEFDREGLPLFILANWRGFSGGQRDLFEGVLQMGSRIVENLRVYRQPVFVYIPPGGELRGGAWVVVDTKINEGKVEMYADPTARGGVLEPEGIVGIKYRAGDLKKTMLRCDPIMGGLSRDLAEAKAAGLPDSAPEQESRRRQMAERESLLSGVYNQVATKFADMHDTPERMLAKGVVRSVVPWEEARSFFCQRLRRRLQEQRVARDIIAVDPEVPEREAIALIQRWYEADPESGARAPGSPTDHDARVAAWLARNPESVGAAVEKIRSSRAAKVVMELAGSAAGQEGLLAGLQLALGGVQNQDMLKALRAALASASKP